MNQPLFFIRRMVLKPDATSCKMPRIFITRALSLLPLLPLLTNRQIKKKKVPVKITIPISTNGFCRKENFSINGPTTLSERNLLNISYSRTATRNIEKNNITRSMTRSTITVPIKELNGTFSRPARAPQRVISPMRGMARFAK